MTASVLIVTLPPTVGGVPAKTEILARFLRDSGYDVTIASYATLSENPGQVIPSWRLLSGRRPTVMHDRCFDDFPWTRVGCYFPELEFSYFRPSDLWREVVDNYDRHIVVSGTVLLSNLLMSFGKPHFVWCASTMIEDRLDRRAAMPWPRRILDQTLVGPIQRRMEKEILSSRTQFLCVSNYTKDTLVAAGGDASRFQVTPVPVDTSEFSPAPSVRRGVIGFAGRADDPRKNIALLLQATAKLIERDPSIRLRLTGDPSPPAVRHIETLGISAHVEWTGWLTQQDLVAFFQSLDVFVFPSKQEGLGISGVQAMACGVPVVSTRCGGPESYVVDGETGVLVDFSVEEMANAVWSVIDDREKRRLMSDNAVTLINGRYGLGRFHDDIRGTWRATWGDEL